MTTITIPTADLARTLTRFREIVPGLKRPVAPVLSNLLAEHTPDGLLLSGFDYENSIRVLFPGDFPAFESALVPYDGFAKAVRAQNKRKADTTELTFESDNVRVAQGSVAHTLRSDYPVAEYPDLPVVDGEGFTIPAGVLADIAQYVLPAVGKDDMLPVLTGVFFDRNGQDLTVAATDRFRLTLAEYQVGGDAKAQSLLVPGAVVKAAAKAFDTDVQASVGNGILLLTGPNVTVTARLLDGEFPKVRRLFPDEYAHQVTVDADRLAEVAKYQAGTESLALDITGSKIRFHADNEFEATVPCTSDGDAKVAFNPKFLGDAAKMFKGRSVTILGTEPTKPRVFTVEEAPHVRHLMMPRRRVDLDEANRATSIEVPKRGAAA